MNFRISSKTRVVESLLDVQKMVEKYTEYVDMEKTAIECSKELPKEYVLTNHKIDMETLEMYKNNFNNILKMIKPYEVG